MILLIIVVAIIGIVLGIKARDVFRREVEIAEKIREELEENLKKFDL